MRRGATDAGKVTSRWYTLVARQLIAPSQAGVKTARVAWHPRDTEEADMERRVVDKNAVKRAAERSTRVSAKLEDRVVPQEFVRSSKVEKFVAARTRRAS